MTEALTYIKSDTKRIFHRTHNALRRGVEQWKLVGLITRRSSVRIRPPLPISQPEGAQETVPFLFAFRQATFGNDAGTRGRGDCEKTARIVRRPA